MNSNNNEKCPICGTVMRFPTNFCNENLCDCKNCGQFLYSRSYIMPIQRADSNKKAKLMHYLFHNNNNDDHIKFIGTKQAYEEFLTNNPSKPIQQVDFDIVENWYPKTFAEKIDKILLKIYKLSAFEGDFVDADEIDKLLFFTTNIKSKTIIDGRECIAQCEFIANYLKENNYVVDENNYFQLKPKALERVYELQKNLSNNKNAFIAMKFGEETKDLRLKLKEGVEIAGYIPRIMDEIEHNHQIVPEMLYEMKNSRFVIAELSHHNNGAYYEAGYALGLGKEVIHICHRKQLNSGLHFDVAQVNTIVYDNIDELSKLLAKRIKATIG